MSVRNPNYQQVHDFYELCSDGRSLQEFCRMSGVSYQKYLEWERNQALGDSQKKLKPAPEPPVNGCLIAVPNVKSGKSYILLKSENARKHGHFREFGG